LEEGSWCTVEKEELTDQGSLPSGSQHEDTWLFHNPNGKDTTTENEVRMEWTMDPKPDEVQWRKHCTTHVQARSLCRDNNTGSDNVPRDDNERIKTKVGKGKWMKLMKW